MNFFFTLELFSFVFLNPRFEADLDKPVVASIRQVSELNTLETQYRYSSDGKEISYDLAPSGGKYRIKVLTRADGFFDALEILQNRAGSLPGGNLVRFQFRYRNDTLVDSILITRNDTLDKVQAYGHDSLGRLVSLKQRQKRPGLPDGPEVELVISHDSTGRGIEFAGTKPGDDIIRFEFDGQGRVTDRKFWDADRAEFLLDMKLFYNAEGQWTKWERFVEDSLAMTYSMVYRPLSQVTGMLHRANPSTRRSGKPAGDGSWTFRLSDRDVLGRLPRRGQVPR